MESSCSINLEACRFCLNECDNLTRINSNIKENFQELMNEEFIENPKFPQNCCKKCKSLFQKFLSFKCTINTIQNQLLNALQNDLKNEKSNTQFIKTEPEDNFEDDFEMKTFFEDFSQMVDTSIKEEFEAENSSSPPPERPKKKSPNKAKRNSASYKPRIKPRINSEYAQKRSYRTNYVCDYCGFEHKHKVSMVRHMKKTHCIKIKKKTETGKEQCTFCNKMFLQSYLPTHIKYLHEKPVEKICEKCGKVFPDNVRYIHHIRSQHTGERPFKCDYCDRRFFNRSLVSSHMYIHHSNKEEVCHICSKSFKNISYLRNHIKHVHEDGQMLCGVDGCQMTFSNKHKLRRHRNKHSGIKKYVCKICNSAYRNCNGLRTHIRTNHIKTSYTCEVPGCNSTYARKDFMRGHVRSHHKELNETQIQEIFQRLRDIPLPSLKSYHDLKIGISE